MSTEQKEEYQQEQIQIQLEGSLKLGITHCINWRYCNEVQHEGIVKPQFIKKIFSWQYGSHSLQETKHTTIKGLREE